jgi:PAT family beta-lactamase induction signal transducer AmpG
MSPWIETLTLPYLGKRFGQKRSWALLSQASLMVSLVLLGSIDPRVHLGALGLVAFWVCLSASTQDLCLEAYRIETTPPDARGSVACAISIGFRCGLVLSGAGSLLLASFLSWQWVYSLMAMGVAVGMGAVLASPPEAPCRVSLGNNLLPSESSSGQRLLAQGLLSRGILSIWSKGCKRFFTLHSPIVLVLMFMYKLPETALNVMNMPFLMAMGYGKAQIATYVQFYGLFFMIAGAFVGGLVLTYWGLKRSFYSVFTLHSLSSVALACHATWGKNLLALTAVMGAENFTMGMTAAVLTAYMGVLCKPPFTSTQYALIASIASLSRVFWSVVWGQVADCVAWPVFFLLVGGASLLGAMGVRLSRDTLTNLWKPILIPPL